MNAADFRRIALSFDGAEEGSPEAPAVFLPVAGGWGRMGATHIRLATANRDMLTGALQTAWKLRVDKNTAQRSTKSKRRARR